VLTNIDVNDTQNTYLMVVNQDDPFIPAVGDEVSFSTGGNGRFQAPIKNRIFQYVPAAGTYTLYVILVIDPIPAIQEQT
jgi:hypothetical protein